jgi:Na+/H+ antiporter NhaD/arsenite permease-like protein
MLFILVIIFVAGYLLITLEHAVKINKAAAALVTGALCWTVIAIAGQEKLSLANMLSHHLADTAQILFFLLGAMTIVELVDAHDGFEIIRKRIRTRSKKKLLWIVCIISFILSAILDNLTTTIVMVSLVRKLISDPEDRLYFAGAIIISANAGGAWSPIGDVTTTMLWIGGQVTALNIMKTVLLPSLASMLVPVAILHFRMKGMVSEPIPAAPIPGCRPTSERHRNFVFFAGIGILLLIPVFKMVTHLPAYLGMLLGLGLLWIIVEILHHDKDDEDKEIFSVAHSLRKIDTPSILFFLGILLAIGALESSGLLHSLAAGLDQRLGNANLVVLSVGLLSAIVDNVPLVAASMGMYDLSQFPADHSFWLFMAYCTGTGGSILVIGSAAGVAAMGMEKIGFVWYLKKISWLALAGFIAGAAVFLAMH